MAEKDKAIETAPKKLESKKLTLGEFLTTVSIHPRHKFVVDRMLAGSEPKTRKQWASELKKIDGINFKISE